MYRRWVIGVAVASEMIARYGNDRNNGEDGNDREGAAVGIAATLGTNCSSDHVDCNI